MSNSNQKNEHDEKHNFIGVAAKESTKIPHPYSNFPWKHRKQRETNSDPLQWTFFPQKDTNPDHNKQKKSIPEN